MTKTTTTYAERLRRAREHAELSQSELGRQIGMSPQAIQYLEDPEQAAQGSHKTARIADACGVRPLWLESGDGVMIADGAPAPLPSAANLARAIKTMRPDLQRALGSLVDELEAPITGARQPLAPGEFSGQRTVRQRTQRGSRSRRN
jgi:transcriptional regulator with XRE-family HTH domain